MANKTTDDELAILRAQVKDLAEKLGMSETRREEAEALSLANSAGGLVYAQSEEQPTGRTVEVEICSNPWVNDIKLQKFTKVKLPTFMFTINLPEGAGTHLATNGFPYYHGETYEIDSQTLTDIKSRVARCWDHEKSIHTPTNKQFNSYIDGRMKSAHAVAKSLPQL